MIISCSIQFLTCCKYAPVTIGKNNITDADSVVTRSIPGYYVAVILASFVSQLCNVFLEMVMPISVSHW